MDENCGEVHVKVQVREANRKRKRNSRCGRLIPKAGKTILVLDGSGLCQNTFLRLNRLNRFGRVEWQEMHPKPLQDASNRICKALATIAWWVQVEGLLQETVTFFHIMCTMKILRGIDISMWYSISSNSSFLISRICWQLMPSSAELEKRWGASCGPIYKHPASWMCDISGVIRSPVFGSKQHMYGNFEGFPLKKCIVWVGNVMTPAIASKMKALFFCLGCLDFPELFLAGETVSLAKIYRQDHRYNKHQQTATNISKQQQTSANNNKHQQTTTNISKQQSTPPASSQT